MGLALRFAVEGAKSMKARGTESRLQFSILAALKVTLIVAVILAAVVPWLRQYDAAQRRAVLSLWASAAASCLVLWILNVFFRYRVRQQGGPVRFVFSMGNGYVYFYVGMCIFIFVIAITMLCTTTLAALYLAPMPFGEWWPCLMSGCVGVTIANALTMLWWRSAQVELRENGIGLFHRFIPWQKIHSTTLDRDSGRLHIVRSGFVGGRLKVTVPETLWPEVEEFLTAVRPVLSPSAESTTGS